LSMDNRGWELIGNVNKAMQFDTYGRIQHEKSTKRACNSKVVRVIKKLGFGNVWAHIDWTCSWDLGGQPRFRSMWERYCRGVNAMVYIVDATDKAALPVAKDELHMLLEKPSLEGIPLLVLGNKNDLENHLSVDELIEELDLKAITKREVSCYGISAKEETNLDAVLNWLIRRSH